MDTTVTLSRTAPSELGRPSFTEVEDYLALGVRPMEVRPAVIRRAVHRSALPLASLHLSHPDRVVEKRLASIVTTGYRLLDPRRRADSMQRMMLGRIHPQLADEAARIAQSKGSQLIAMEAGDEIDFVPYEGNGLYKRQGHVRANRASSTEHFYFLDNATSQWSDSLRSHDLLVERPFKRAIRSTRRWLSQRYVAAGALIGCVLISFSAWRMFRADEGATIGSFVPGPVSSTVDPVVPQHAMALHENREPSAQDPRSGDTEPVHSEQVIAHGVPLRETTSDAGTLGLPKRRDTSPPLLAPEPVIPASYLRAMVAAETSEEGDILSFTNDHP